MIDLTSSSLRPRTSSLNKDSVVGLPQIQTTKQKFSTDPVSYPGKSSAVVQDATSVFRDHFDILSADTQRLRDEVFRLRYQVYCSEKGFENPKEFPDRLERDEYDHRSLHSLLRHRRTGINAGTVRLILPESGRLSSLPIHSVTDHPFFLDQSRFSASSVAEVSRFAISKTFRRRLLEFASPSAAGPLDHRRARLQMQQEQLVLPHITLGLFVGMVRMSYEMGIRTWFCVMERALMRLLARYSLHFEPVGPTVEYHGKRQPCYADIETFLARVKAEQPDIWRLITADGAYWSTRRPN